MNIMQKIMLLSVLIIASAPLSAAEVKAKAAVAQQSVPTQKLDVMSVAFVIFKTYGPEELYRHNKGLTFNTLSDEQKNFVLNEWINQAIAKQDAFSLLRLLETYSLARNSMTPHDRQRIKDAIKDIETEIADRLKPFLSERELARPA